ncbi:MAG: hypothetical protein JKY48_20525 [Flavobacteriales bacterium]|nr:hypothetical protein [Flavobacteriales bacterium]
MAHSIGSKETCCWVFRKFFRTIGFLVNAERHDYVETLIWFDYSYLPEVMMETFSFMDLVFYGIAVNEGYEFSFRLNTQKSFQDLNIEGN